MHVPTELVSSPRWEDYHRALVDYIMSAATSLNDATQALADLERAVQDAEEQPT